MYIELSHILEETNGGLDIILRYYPQAEPAVTRKGYKFKIRGTEKTASATLKKLDDGNYVVTDFGGDQVPRNAVHVCMLEENLDFGEACRKLAADFNIGPDELKAEIYKPEISTREATAEEEDGKWFFEVREEFTELDIRSVLSEKVIPYSDKEKKTINQEKVEEVFKKYHFYSLTSYTIIKNRKAITIASTDNYPIMMWDEGEFKKLYQPLSPDKSRRFIYYGKRPKDFLHGYTAAHKAYENNTPEGKEEINEETGEIDKPAPERLDYLMYCSGGSDALNIAMIGYEVVWPNSETAKLTNQQFKKLSKISEKVVNVADIDTTGLREAHRLAMEYLELYTLYPPSSLRERKDRRGNPCKDIRDYFNYHNYYDFKELLSTALPYQFWDVEYSKTKSGKWKENYSILNTELYNFLHRNGFYRLVLENEKEGHIYIHITDNIVRQIKPNEIKAYVHNFLEKRYLSPRLRDAFYNTPKLSETSLSNLKVIEIEFKDFDKHTQFFFFRNKTISVTKDKINEFKPGEIDRFVWDDEVIKHQFKIQDPQFRIWKNDADEWDIEIKKNDNIFFNYLIQTSRMHWRKELEEELEGKTAEERNQYLKDHKYDIAGPNLAPEEIIEQKQHLINKMYSLGYLLHRYRDPSRPWAVFAMDGRLSEDGQSNGRSGKSIMYKAIRLFMKSVTLPGRKHDLTKDQFIYSGVTRHTDFILVDDANQYLDFSFFFEATTGELTVNPKFGVKFELKSEEVPKFAFTSNHPVRDIDSSKLDRLLYTVFSDYYHKDNNGFYLENRSPKDDFGKNILNEDFTTAEWNDFYNFMIQCCNLYMQHEKIEPPMNNIEKRNLISEMGSAFHEWADVYFSEEMNTLDTLVPKVEAFEDFKKATNAKWTSQKFRKAIMAWSKYYGFELNPKEFQNSQGRISRKWPEGAPDAKATELIYIRTKLPKQENKEIEPF